MRRRIFLAALLPAGFATAVSAQDRLSLVATFSILGDLAGEVGGERVEVRTLVGPDTDSHLYQPTPADVRALARAQALVSNGLGFEGWLGRLAQAATFEGRRIVATTGVPVMNDDPHCWHDVACTRRYVANIADGLESADPANAGYYRERARVYDLRLAALDSWIRSEIDTVPEKQRKAITGHDAFRYFARAYGVTFEAARGYAADSEPSARDMAKLIRHAREQKIKALFIENMSSPVLVREIAEDVGAVVGPPLYSDALSPAGGPAATYEAMMRHNVVALVAGMLRN